MVGCVTGLGGHSATQVCNRSSWLATSTFTTNFFVGHTCAKHSRQRYVTTGRDKGVCNRVGGGGPATKRGFDSQPYIHIYICTCAGFKESILGDRDTLTKKRESNRQLNSKFDGSWHAI